MLIAKEKRENNIAEYIIYIWQLEDLMRALNFDLDQVDKNLVSKFEVNNQTKTEIKNWYENLIALIKTEKLEKGGHTQFIKNIVNDLNDLHLRLLNKPEETQYRNIYQQAKLNIEALKEKGNGSYENDIDVALSGIYAMFLLKLKNIQINEATQSAIESYSRLLALLSTRFHQVEKGELEL